jgi:hypothetical protein
MSTPCSSRKLALRSWACSSLKIGMVPPTVWIGCGRALLISSMANATELIEPDGLCRAEVRAQVGLY